MSEERLRVHSPITTSDLSVGESVAVSGICLTAALINSESEFFEFDISPETFSRTTLGSLLDGGKVNLELAMAMGERFGGHLLQGHIDAIGKLLRIEPQGEARLFTFDVNPQYDSWIVEKGSIAIDGISLTPFNIQNGQFDVAVIPHTYDCTTLKGMKVGAKVNVEFDILAKYVQKQLRGEDHESKHD